MSTDSPKPKNNTLGHGLAYLFIGHIIAFFIYLTFVFGGQGFSASTDLIQFFSSITFSYLMLLPIAQVLYLIPLLIIFAVKRSWNVFWGLVMGFSLTWLLSFGLCVGLGIIFKIVN